MVYGQTLTLDTVSPLVDTRVAVDGPCVGLGITSHRDHVDCSLLVLSTFSPHTLSYRPD